MTLERRQVLAPAVLLFGILVAHALLETARDALFLARLGPQHLATAYITIAGAALVAMVLLRRWTAMRDPRRLLVATLVLASVGTSILAVTITEGSALVFVLYVWTGLVATLVVPSFWTMVDRSNRVVEAKRRFARISAGGVLGAMVGSALAGALGHVLPAHSLVVAAAITFAAVAASAWFIAPPPADQDLPDRIRPGPEDRPRTPRYLRLLLVLGILSTVTVTLVDLTFKRAFADAFEARDLATAFGALYTLLNFVALVIQLAVTGRLLERLGVAGALTILPGLIVLTATGFVLTGTFASVLLLKLSDGGLRHSLHRVASEILYLPVAQSVRNHWKPIIDAVGQRGGQVLAALLWFVVMREQLSLATVATGLALLGVAWLAAVRVTRRGYIAQFRSMVAAGEIERDVRLATLDADASQLLTEALASPDELEALAALEVLAHADELPSFVLYHPSPTVVRGALELLSRQHQPGVARVLAHLVDHSDPKVRAAALAAAGRLGTNHAQLRAALDEPDPDIHATAAVWLVDDEELTSLEKLGHLAHGTVDERVALARAIESRPIERFRPLLETLLAGEEPAVLRAALRVLQRAPSLAQTARLLQLLETPHVRGDARRVFVALGEAGLSALITALEDPRLPLGVRRHLPRTLSRFHSRRAAAALVARLLREPDGTVEFKILRALGRMRADDPTLPIDTAVLHAYVRRSLDDAARYTMYLDRIAADAGPTVDLIRELAREKQRWAIEHAFRGLGILFPRGGVRSLYGAFVGASKERRDAAREIVESMLPSEQRAVLFAIVDDLPSEERHRRLASTAAAQHPLTSDEQLFLALLTDPSESLRCLTAHHIAERHLDTLRHHLDRLRPDVGPPLVTYAFDQAIASLDA